VLSGSGLRILQTLLLASSSFCKLFSAVQSEVNLLLKSALFSTEPDSPTLLLNRILYAKKSCCAVSVDAHYREILKLRKGFFEFFSFIFYSFHNHMKPTGYAQSYPQKFMYLDKK
ncbi:hypothetical protein L2734_07820, partial [Parashewanella spongiae]|uniref:hypothetical protein n=1 Tax=Parashewanella spongiae TaxID=342950 RepID=UPI00200F9A02